MGEQVAVSNKPVVKSIEPPVKVSINRIEVVSGALFLANAMTIPVIIFAILGAVVAAFLLPTMFPDFKATYLIPMVLLIVIVPIGVWISNFIGGLIFISVGNGAMKFSRPKLLMQQL